MSDPVSDLNTQRKGYLGEQAVINQIIKDKHLKVYKSGVDDSGVDLVVDTGTCFKKVQVKTKTKTRTSKTSIEVDVEKYVGSDIDVIAIYYEPLDMVAYVPYDNQKDITLAVKRAKNGQKHNRTWFFQFLEFPI